MRLERAADSVTENTPIVIISGTALMLCRQHIGVDNTIQTVMISIPEDSCSC